MPVRPGTIGLLERGEQEHRGLEALTEHGEERHDHEADRRALDQRDRGPLLEVALEVGGVAPHPHDHPRDHPDGDQRDDRLELLLLASAGGSPRRRAGRTPTPAQSSTADATPSHIHRSASLATLLAEEGGDDPDDQRRLETLPQADDEGGKHEPEVRQPLGQGASQPSLSPRFS